MSVVLKTYGEQLSEVQEAIHAVNTAQSYELNGRKMQKADLEFLHSREKWLTDMLNTYGDVTAGSMTVRGSARVSFS